VDKIVKSLTDAFAATQGLVDLEEATQFEAFVANAVLSSYFEDDFNPLDFVIGAGGDLGVDVAAVLVNGDLLLDAADVKLAVANSRQLDVKFVFVQAKRSQHFDSSVFTELGDNLCHLICEDGVKYPANPDVLNLKEAIDAVYSDLGKFSRSLPEVIVRYATTGVVGDPLLQQKAAAATKRLDDTNYFTVVDVEPIGARKLRDLHQAATAAVSAEFTMDKRLTLPKLPGVTQAFIGVLPAMDLVEILRDSAGGIRKSVFFDNVRDFQDFNPVNEEILETLRDDVSKNRFAVLNNGITIVTRSLTLAGDDFQLKDFQIVNGCQTCHVLFHAQGDLTADVQVSVRLIQSQDEDVISGITAATNRQTAVTDDDLAAREQFHKDLEALFTTFEPAERLYYERRSKQYANLDVERTRVMTRSQLTRTFASMFLDEPARAGRYVKELKEARKSDLFNPSQNPLSYYTSAAAFYRIEWLFRNKRVDRSYTPARYQLLMAIKVNILGDIPLPAGDRKSKTACQQILEVVWDADASETLIKEILPMIDEVVVDETPGMALSRDTVRTRAFSDGLKAKVLFARTSDGGVTDGGG
jgi:hypothetical protein